MTGSGRDTDGPPDERRRYPSTVGGLVYILVGLLMVVALAVVALDSWRRGITMMGLLLLVAAAARAVLPRSAAGMLEVRGRWFDVVSLAAVGTTLILLALNIPDQLP